MGISYDKADLFNDFCIVTREAAESLERYFGITNVYDQVLGDSGDTAQEEKVLRSSPAWVTLCALYDYALLGRLDGRDPHDVVIDGASVLALVTTENHRPDEAWSRIVAMGDARFALDTGEDVELGRVALLAHVDVRTVRNAVSNGELLATKEAGLQFIDNATARRWLAGRRGFKPTEVDDDSLTLAIGSVSTPADFASLLKTQRKQLSMDKVDAKLTVMHPSASAAALAQLEAGVFAMPLDTVFPLADFYQLPRKDFLACVMRVFFRQELDTIVGATGRNGEAA